MQGYRDALLQVFVQWFQSCTLYTYTRTLVEVPFLLLFFFCPSVLLGKVFFFLHTPSYSSFSSSTSFSYIRQLICDLRYFLENFSYMSISLGSLWWTSASGLAVLISMSATRLSSIMTVGSFPYVFDVCTTKPTKHNTVMYAATC